jgi:hypothetical protein
MVMRQSWVSVLVAGLVALAPDCRSTGDASQYRLTAEGERKLRVAGQFDIRAFFQWAEGRRSYYRQTSGEPGDFLKHIRRDKDRRIDTMFGAGSFYAKVLNTLAPEAGVPDLIGAEADGR